MNKALYFALGAVTGAAGTYFALRAHFLQVANNEIREVREFYQDKINELHDRPIENDHQTEEPSPLEHVIKVRESVDDEIKAEYEKHRHNYGAYFKPLNAPPDTDGDNTVHDPYKEKDLNAYEGISLIAPEEFGQLDGYTECSLTYFAGDKVLCDEEDDPVPAISLTIGETFMDHFGDYQPDVVHVRNERTMTDYEITLDERRYDDLYPERHVHDMDVEE